MALILKQIFQNAMTVRFHLSRLGVQIIELGPSIRTTTWPGLCDWIYEQ